MYGRYSIQARLCSQYKRQHIKAFSSARLQKYNFLHEYSNGLLNQFHAFVNIISNETVWLALNYHLSAICTLVKKDYDLKLTSKFS